MAVEYAANTYAMYMLGVMYEKGQYVQQDINTAISWYKKASLQGSNEAIERLKTLEEMNT